MTEFEAEVLYGVYREAVANVDDDPDNYSFDTSIHGTGRELFGPSWGGRILRAKPPAHHVYAPMVALALGRLAAAGYIKKVTYGSQSYVCWTIADKGIEFMDGHPLIELFPLPVETD